MDPLLHLIDWTGVPQLARWLLTAMPSNYRPLYAAVILAAVAIGAAGSIRSRTPFDPRRLLIFGMLLVASGGILAFLDQVYLRHYGDNAACPLSDYATHVSALPMVYPDKWRMTLGQHGDSDRVDCQDIDRLAALTAPYGLAMTVGAVAIAHAVLWWSFSALALPFLTLGTSFLTKRKKG
jgi:hypothetical protein